MKRQTTGGQYFDILIALTYDPLVAALTLRQYWKIWPHSLTAESCIAGINNVKEVAKLCCYVYSHNSSSEACPSLISRMWLLWTESTMEKKEEGEEEEEEKEKKKKKEEKKKEKKAKN